MRIIFNLYCMYRSRGATVRHAFRRAMHTYNKGY